jgi:putative ABC transport system substrate-binding protein
MNGAMSASGGKSGNHPLSGSCLLMPPTRTSPHHPFWPLAAISDSLVAVSLALGQAMRRRDLLSLVGSAAAWPLVARAQQRKLVRLGYLQGETREDATVQNLRRQFVLGMRDLDYIEGRDYVLEERYFGGQIDRAGTYAQELVDLRVNVIVAGGEAAIRAVKRVTSQIPIVMTLAADPVGSGLVPTLAHPGGNITGMSALASDLASKRVELLKELVAQAKRVAVLWNPSNQSKVTEWKDTQIAAQSAGMTLLPVEAQTSAEIDQALQSIKRERPDAMIVLTESFTLAFRQQIGEFAVANRLPMIAELREFVVVGGLASYGASRADLWRRSATYVVKILQGDNPGDLPVEQPTRFELVISLKTAKAFGLAVPPALLTRADEVIE